VAGPINVIPVGYLDQLGLRRMGQSPPQSTDFVQPVLELGKQYLEWLAIVAATNATNITANGDVIVAGTPDFSVAQNEYWYVKSATWQVVAAAGTTCTVTPYWQVPAAGTFVRTFVGPRTAILAGTSIVLIDCPRDIWLPPGARAALFVQDFAGAGTPTFNVALRYTVLNP